MGRYDDEIASAAEMLAEAGAPIQVVSFEKVPAKDLEQRWSGTSPEFAQETSGVFLDASLRRVLGTLTPEAEQGVLVPAKGLEDPPRLKGEIRTGPDFDDRWRIVSVKPLSPGGEPILYEVGVAR